MNSTYLAAGNLYVELMGRDYTWLDTGTHDRLHDASSFVRVLENRQKFKIACLEEIAWTRGYISTDELANQASTYGPSIYGDYLRQLVGEVQ